MNTSDKLEKTVCDPAYKAVSFDIFDTLLVRPCLRPTDIFRLAGRAVGCSEAFTDVRRACEAAARREHSSSEDIKTADIYDVMRRYLGLTPEKADEIMRAELECEQALLRPRESVKRIFELAKDAGKTVIVISDMYLSEEFLGNILHGCGYDGYDRLYVSSEYNAAKYSGRLFRIAAEDMKKRGIKPSEILHIGDNEYSDVEQARRRGFAAFHIPGTADTARCDEHCRRLLSLTDPQSDNTYLIGHMINRYFDLPRPDGTTPAETAAAPLLMSLALRILSDCVENGVTRLIFPKNGCGLLEEVTALAAAYVLPSLEITRESRHDGAREAAFAAEPNGGITADRVYTLFSGGSPRSGIISLIRQGAISRRLYGETAAEIKALINSPTDSEACGRILDYCRSFCSLFGSRLGCLKAEPYQFYEFLRELHLREPAKTDLPSDSNGTTPCAAADELVRKAVSDKYSVICFGLFDALLLPTGGERGIYDLLGRKLGSGGLAREAERIILRERRNNGGISSERLFALLSEECPRSAPDPAAAAAEERALYTRLCFARRSMTEVWNAAKAAGKRICVVGDSCISSETALMLLEKNGFCGCDRLILSSEHSFCGGVSGVISAQCSDIASPSEILYLGSDAAEMSPLNAVVIPSPQQRIRELPALRDIYDDICADGDNGFLAAYSAALMFDDPFRPYSQTGFFNSDPAAFAQLVFAPLILGYSKWVLDECERRGIGRICFTDAGESLVESMLSQMSEYYTQKEIKRLGITDAAVCTLFAGESGGLSESLYECPMTHDMTAEEFINEHLLAGNEEQRAAAMSALSRSGMAQGRYGRERYMKLAPELGAIFEKNGAEYARAAEEYIRSVTGGGAAVVDTGCSGSVGRILARRNDNITGFRLFDESHGNNISAAVFLGISDLRKTEILTLLTDELINSGEPRARRFGFVGGKPVPENEKRKAPAEKTRLIQRCCAEYARGFIGLFGEYIRLLDIDLVSYAELAVYVTENLTAEDALIFADMGGEKDSPYAALYRRICSGKRQERPDAADDRQRGSAEKILDRLRRSRAAAPLKALRRALRSLKGR